VKKQYVYFKASVAWWVAKATDLHPALVPTVTHMSRATNDSFR